MATGRRRASGKPRRCQFLLRISPLPSDKSPGDGKRGDGRIPALALPGPQKAHPLKQRPDTAVTRARRPSPGSCGRCAPLWGGGPRPRSTVLALFGVSQRSGQQSGDPGHGEALRLFCPCCVPGAECVPGRCRSCPVSCEPPHRNHCEAVTGVPGDLESACPAKGGQQPPSHGTASLDL